MAERPHRSLVAVMAATPTLNRDRGPLPQAERPREEPVKRPWSDDEPGDGSHCPHMCLAVVKLGLMADAVWSSGPDLLCERARHLWLAYHRHEPPGRYLRQLDALLARDEAPDGTTRKCPPSLFTRR